MFLVSLLFLLITGALLHLTQGDLTSPLGVQLLIVLGFLYLLFVAETILHWRSGGNNLRQHARYLLMPMMRICPRDHVDGKSAWIPLIGWRSTSTDLEKFLARVFSGPMIVIALLVLPVVAIEFMYAEKIEDSPISKFAIDTCSGFIWMAFVFEFVVMFSVVEKRLRYCRQNWIDVAVVLLPLVSFMGAARLGRLVKLKQLSRTAKIYRMRGLALRSWRAIVALDVIDTLLRRDPEQRMDRLRAKIEEKQEEIDQLRRQLARIKDKSFAPTAESETAELIDSGD
jgi:voltage-gated potassium channel